MQAQTKTGIYQPWTGTEDTFSAAFSLWLWNERPQTRRTIWHVENEAEKLKGESHASHMRRLSKSRAKGSVPGVWDYTWIWDGHVYIIELKVGKGVLSDEQKEVRDALISANKKAYLEGRLSFHEFRSLDAVKEWVDAILYPMQ